MGLIELLLENWFFLLLILWFLSSVMGKRKKETADETHEPIPTVETSEKKEPSFEFPWEKVERHDQQRMEMELEQERSGRNQYSWSDDEESPIVHHPSIKKERSSTMENARKTSLGRSERSLGGSAITSQAIGSIGEIDGDLSNTKRSSTTSKGTTTLHPAKVDVNQAMQGMIWAQVFGKPRAKEPHRSLLGRNRMHR